MQERSHYGMSCPVQPGVQCDMNKLGDMKKEDSFSSKEMKKKNSKPQTCKYKLNSTNFRIQICKSLAHWANYTTSLLTCIM